MEEIMKRLIEARHKANLSLQDIHERTRISLKQLEHLEALQFDKIGPAVYVRGFMRRYAQEVGIDPDTLWEPEDSQVVVAPARVPRHHLTRRKFEWGPLVRVIVIVAILALVGVLIRAAILNFLQPAPPAPPAPPEQQEQEDPNLEEPQPEPILSEIAANDSEAVYAVQNVDALEIVITYSGNCWTRIFVDGEKTREGTFGAGHSEEIGPAQVVRIRFGAPKYVNVEVNGMAIETPDITRGFNLEIRLEEDGQVTD